MVDLDDLLQAVGDVMECLVLENMKRSSLTFRRIENLAKIYEQYKHEEEEVSSYFKNNHNLWNICLKQFSEEKVIKERAYYDKHKNSFEDYKPDSTEYGIVIEGKMFELGYEDMVEILYAMDTCSFGNECFIGAKLKVDYIKKYLPNSYNIDIKAQTVLSNYQPDTDKYAVIVNNKRFTDIAYEEMVEITSAIATSTAALNTATHHNAKQKALFMGKFLPVTDY